MKERKALALQIAGAIALATLFGTSAFAESRHSSGTHSSSHSSAHSSGGHSFIGHIFSGRSGNSGGHVFSGHDSFSGRNSAPRTYSERSNSSRGFGSRNSAPRSYAPRSYAPRNYSQRSYSPRNQSWRGGARGGFGPGFRNFNDGHRFVGQGRIERFERWNGGYRVWLGGWGYPFFVPLRFWDPFRFRLGLFIGFNAFYDPFGYYSVYGWPGYYAPPVYASGPYVYRDGDYRDGDYNNNSRLDGTVQSVDLQTGIVVIEDSQSHRVYRALLPPRDNRVDDIRPGDYVEFSGDWVRGRQYDFDADRMDHFDARR